MSAVEPLVHVVREATGEPQGALILLHGRGTDQHDLLPLMDVLDPQRRLVGLTPGAPLVFGPGQRHWYVVPRVGYPDVDTFHAAYAQLTGFLDGWLAQRGIAWDRTILGGFSMGCVMSYATGLGPDRPSPAGILALSGFIPTVEGWEPDLGDRAGLAVMIAHGARDPIISIDFARSARDRLTAAGLAVTYDESQGGHNIDPRTVPALVEWVAQRV